MDKTILIIQMFSGKYIMDIGSNSAKLGHEVFNLFKTDDGEIYLYAPRRGAVNSNNYVAAMLLYYRGDGEYELLGIAENLSMIEECNLPSEIPLMNYAGVNIDEILTSDGSNPYLDINGKLRSRDERISLKARNLKIPEQKVILRYVDDLDSPKAEIFDTKIIIPLHMPQKDNWKRLHCTAQRVYVSEKDDGLRYEELDTKVLQSDYIDWKNAQGLSLDEIRTNAVEETTAGFLSLVRKEESELAYSNLLEYFLSRNKKLLAALLGRIKKEYGCNDDVTNESDASIEVQREKDFIDLFVSSKKACFIIENKIHADLSQDSEGNHQIQRYIDNVESDDIKEGLQREIYACAICPKYHSLNKAYEKGSTPEIVIRGTSRKLPIITYEEIFHLFKSLGLDSGDEQSQIYFNDFLKALDWHKTDHTKLPLRENMKRRLSRALANIA